MTLVELQTGAIFECQRSRIWEVSNAGMSVCPEVPSQGHHKTLPRVMSRRKKLVSLGGKLLALGHNTYIQQRVR